MDQPELDKLTWVNSSKTQAKRIQLPDRDRVDWDSLDFWGWRDPKAPQRGYLIVPADDGWIGIALTTTSGGGKKPRAGMCSLCLTPHPMSSIGLFAAPRAGAAGRNGNTVGRYICADLQCSLYIRGILKPEGMSALKETLSPQEKAARLELNLHDFVHQVIDG